MMLGIVIPYYKLTFFRETLQSLASQTDQRFQVYIGDDASPEDPKMLLKEFDGKFKFIYKRFQNNLGSTSLTKHWERCLEMAQDEKWFMILGDDDFLCDTAVACFYLTVNNLRNPRVLRFDVQVVDVHSNPIIPHIHYPYKESSVDFIVKRSQNSVRSSLSEYVFRIEDYKKFGITTFPKAFYSDNMMVLEYSAFSVINKIQNARVYIRVSDLSISGNAINDIDLQHASYVFYTNLIQNHASKFSQQAKTLFSEYVLAGQLLGVTNLSFYRLFKILVRNIQLRHFPILLMRWFKYRLITYLR